MGRGVQGGWGGEGEQEGEICVGRGESNSNVLSLGTVRCPRTLMDTSSAAPWAAVPTAMSLPVLSGPPIHSSFPGKADPEHPRWE